MSSQAIKTSSKLKCVLISERYYSVKATCCIIPTIWDSIKGKPIETVKWLVVARGWENPMDGEAWWVVLSEDSLKGCCWGVGWSCSHFKALLGEDLFPRNGLLTRLLAVTRKPTSKLAHADPCIVLPQKVVAAFLQSKRSKTEQEGKLPQHC